MKYPPFIVGRDAIVNNGRSTIQSFNPATGEKLPDLYPVSDLALATAVRQRSWVTATIDTAANIRSMYVPLNGPVVIFGPNNLP